MKYTRIFFSFLLCAVSHAQTCPTESTPSDQAGPFYRANSPLTNWIGPHSLESSKQLIVSGHVRSSRDCSILPVVGVPGVHIEIWYAGDPDQAGNYYQDDQYRGQVVTDCHGFYNYTQQFPAIYPMRPTLHNHLRLEQNNVELLVTQMYFRGDDFGYVNEQERGLLAVNVAQDASSGIRRVEFDIYVDADGDPDACVGNQSSSHTASPVVAPTSIAMPTVAPAAEISAAPSQAELLDQQEGVPTPPKDSNDDRMEARAQPSFANAQSCFSTTLVLFLVATIV